jgi:hypothetical protein
MHQDKEFEFLDAPFLGLMHHFWCSSLMQQEN